MRFPGAILVACLAGMAAAGMRADDPPKPAAKAPAPAKPSSAAKARAAEDARAVKALAKLTADEQRDLVDYLRLACREQRSLQAALVEHALSLGDKNPELWPEVEPIAWYDPAKHAPAQPIPRRMLSPSDREVKRLAAALADRKAPRAVRSAWSYDYGARTLRRAKDWRSSERVLRNALAGVAPDADLATALVEKALDDGSQQKELAAFAHAYTDRAGGAYPGITLYDAWKSGVEIEMPDVDCLGIVHDVLDKWSRWTAPVPAPQQPSLYAAIGDLYQGAHRHESLRAALARAYLEGDAVLDDGYQGNLDNFHALWASKRSTPVDLAPLLPKPAAWSEFLEAWTKTCHDDPAIYQAGVARHAELVQDAESVRAAALQALTEFGAYAKLDAAAAAKSDPSAPR